MAGRTSGWAWWLAGLKVLGLLLVGAVGAGEVPQVPMLRIEAGCIRQRSSGSGWMPRGATW